MHKFVKAETKSEAQEIAGRDWQKVVKVKGGFMFFSTKADYAIWKNKQIGA